MSFRHLTSTTSSPAATTSHQYGNLGSISSSSSMTASTAHVKFGPRALRSETRAKAKDEIKRVMNAIEKVKKWEKRWVSINDSSLKLFRWMPVIPTHGPSSENTKNPSTIYSQTAEYSNITGKKTDFQSSINYSSSQIDLNNNSENTHGMMMAESQTSYDEHHMRLTTSSNQNRVLNHDENAQDSLTGPRNNAANTSKDEIVVRRTDINCANTEEFTNDNNSQSSSSSAMSNSSLSLSTLPNMNQLDNNGKNVQFLTDSDSSNPISKVNSSSNIQDQYEDETINKAKISYNR